MTYNLRGGGVGNSHWGRIIDDFNPDVFLVQESYHPLQHLPSLLYGNQYRDAHWMPIAGLKWGSAVYLKGTVARLLELPDFHGQLIGVEVERTAFPITEGRSLRVFTVHAPDRGGYQRAVNSILDLIAEHRGKGELLIGGDFNLTVGERAETEDLRTSTADLAILARLRDQFGLTAAWPAANPSQSLPQTLRWAKDKTTPYHCDGVFIPQRWKNRLRSCRVISGPEWDRLSRNRSHPVEQ